MDGDGPLGFREDSPERNLLPDFLENVFFLTFPFSPLLNDERIRNGVGFSTELMRPFPIGPGGSSVQKTAPFPVIVVSSFLFPCSVGLFL